ncbi:hypothetical protein OE88DRAFT_1648691 [Heliocybe sulcata]|uniref:Uncharacterized protein n=1 Tax=Heliocybe sulcata TaxID=5364 RepID=A0A5C3MQF9_9AGAM|nr:hypothetical protein OE88DRAFT_1648691 [Heliocybe sulcata]
MLWSRIAFVEWRAMGEAKRSTLRLARPQPWFLRQVGAQNERVHDFPAEGLDITQYAARPAGNELHRKEDFSQRVSPSQDTDVHKSNTLSAPPKPDGCTDGEDGAHARVWDSQEKRKHFASKAKSKGAKSKKEQGRNTNQKQNQRKYKKLTLEERVFIDLVEQGKADDQEAFEEAMSFRAWNNGFSESEVEELSAQFVNPWDDDAEDVLRALHREYARR